jgi:protease IV
MDKNRKILVSISAFLLLSLLLSVMQIYLSMDKTRGGKSSFISDTSPGVGIVRINGIISMTGVQSISGEFPGAEGIISRLNDMESDDSIKVIVLRINSPGGSVGATQELFQKLYQIRKKNKIIVASMGDVAASGGYYAASACDYIMANHGTITASIGVIIDTPNLKGLFEKLGIKMNVIRSGKYKDILNSSRDVTDDERILLQNLIDSSYNQFLSDISLGRNIPIDKIRPYADGRIMGGDAALEAKLIDGIGTFEDAIAKAKSLAKLPEDAPVYENHASPFEQFFGAASNAITANPVNALLHNQPSLPIEYRYVQQ